MRRTNPERFFFFFALFLVLQLYQITNNSSKVALFEQVLMIPAFKIKRKVE